MLCAILKRPDETAEVDVEIVFQEKPILGVQKAIIKRPKGRIRTSFKRLSTFSWSRNHCYGYVLLRSGDLYKIDGIEGGTVGSPATVVYLMSAGERFKISAYCKCGGAMTGSFAAKDDTPAQQCLDVFRSVHSREECGPTDARTAEKARRRKKALKDGTSGSA